MEGPLCVLHSSRPALYDATAFPGRRQNFSSSWLRYFALLNILRRGFQTFLTPIAVAVDIDQLHKPFWRSWLNRADRVAVRLCCDDGFQQIRINPVRVRSLLMKGATLSSRLCNVSETVRVVSGATGDPAGRSLCESTTDCLRRVSVFVSGTEVEAVCGTSLPGIGCLRAVADAGVVDAGPGAGIASPLCAGHNISASPKELLRETCCAIWLSKRPSSTSPP